MLTPTDERALWTRVEERAMRAKCKAAQPSKQMFLPGLHDFMRAMPNHIARSSLFAPVAPGKRRIHDGTVLVSRTDAVIRFKGKQLDEAQADVWMQAMYEVSKQPLGEPVMIKRSAFLKAIGRTPAGENYKWLHRTMEDLAFAMLVIEITKNGQPKQAIGKTDGLHMIDGFKYDDETETYTLRIAPSWRKMYSNREFALIDWNKRLRFGRHQNMAKALQRLVAASNNPQQYFPLEWLKRKLIYEGRRRDFIDALYKAAHELERLEIVSAWKIGLNTKGQEQLTVWRPAS